MSHTSIIIKKNIRDIRVEIIVPASKSESNRALIIDALSTTKGHINNLSIARDTQTLKKLLASDNKILDVIDAGTTMRFLTAYLAVTNQHRILTGTQRMCERPIGILVDALRSLGANIEYTENEGFPPISINGLEKQTSSSIIMKGNVSSQYISAILMIAPLLKHGLRIELDGKITSKPYIEMTLAIMKYYGVASLWKKNIIEISNQPYQSTNFFVDPDWSGASYWFSICALAPKAEIVLKGFKIPSFQGDHVIMEIMKHLGVKSDFVTGGLKLAKTDHEKEFKFDFSDCPDLAQTVAVVCAAKGIHAHFKGLESLRIKETDRISALQKELGKLGAKLIEVDIHHWKLLPSETELMSSGVNINTYEDHRMAMAFAPLATLMDIKIENPDVVQKSYPTFWQDMDKAGFEMN